MTVTNSSSSEAQDVQVASAFSSQLIDSTWTATSRPFPKFAAASELLGPSAEPKATDPFRPFGDYVGSLGDIDGDGKVELYAYESVGDRIFWGGDLNQSSTITGTFLAPLADVNGDGIDDFRIQVGDKTELVFGHTNFSRTDTIDTSELDRMAIGSYKWLTPAGDLNGDGHDDWISEEKVLIGDSHGIVTNNRITAEVIRGKEPIRPIGDLNGDGKVDMLTNSGRDRIGYGRETFETEFDFATEKNRSFSFFDDCWRCSPQSFDANTDGFDDLIYSDSGSLVIVFGNENFAEEDWDDSESFSIDFDDEIFDFASGDYNGDGFDELAVSFHRHIEIFSIKGLTGDHKSKDLLADPDHETLTFQATNGPGTVLQTIRNPNSEVDDLMIGESTFFDSHTGPGKVQLLKGRQVIQHSGEGEIPPFNIPTGGTLTLKVRGTLPEDMTLDRNVSAIASGQRQLNPSLATTELMSPSVDFNHDGSTDFIDFLILSSNFTATDAIFEQGDANGDGLVDFVDFLILTTAFE